MKRRQFLTYLGCGCCALALNTCATTPITGRKQLKIYPESMINAQAAKAYNNFKRKAKLSKDLATLNSIKTIGKKMEIAISEYFKETRKTILLKIFSGNIYWLMMTKC